MNIRTCIIDDEAPVRKVLRHFLTQIENVTIVAEASSASEALSAISRENPHLVFLDIQMPGIDGIELSRVLLALPERPLIVFATAHEEYAIEAFDLEAFDYLLKPFTLDRLTRTVERATRFFSATGGIDQPQPEKESETLPALEPCEDSGLLLLAKGKKLIPVAASQIVFATVEEGRVLVATPTDTYTTRLHLHELEDRLRQHSFIRTHRNSLVNIRQILEVIPWFNRNYKLVMNDRQRTEIIVSRNQSRLLRNLFSL